jgi:quinol monooxygenase YgiN
MATIISKDSHYLTLINIFNTEPAHQREVVDLLTQVTADRVARQPGFVSSSLHQSHDGKRVVMYAQWRSRKDYEAMRGGGDSQATLEKLPALATFEPGTFDVVETFTGQ